MNYFLIVLLGCVKCNFSKFYRNDPLLATIGIDVPSVDIFNVRLEDIRPELLVTIKNIMRNKDEEDHVKNHIQFPHWITIDPNLIQILSRKVKPPTN